MAEFSDTIALEQRTILIERAAPYSTKEDRLDNFTKIAQICSGMGLTLSGADIALVLLAVKLARYGNLRSQGHAPESGTQRDSLIDGLNYWELLALKDIEELTTKGQQ